MNEEIKNENVNEEINPNDIQMTAEMPTPSPSTEDDDSDMPKPQTKVYKKYLKCSDKFMELFKQCTSTLPYNTVLKNKDGGSIRLIDLVKFVEAHKDNIAVDDMNALIAYIANLDFEHARPLMEIVENKDEQRVLWALIEQ